LAPPYKILDWPLFWNLAAAKVLKRMPSLIPDGNHAYLHSYLSTKFCDRSIPEVAARMYDTVVCLALAESFSHQSVVISVELHRQLVVGSLKPRHQLLPNRRHAPFPVAFHIHFQPVRFFSGCAFRRFYFLRLKRRFDRVAQQTVQDNRYLRVSCRCD